MIGKILMEMRTASGFTQKELAIKSGIAQTTISGYETNSSMPNFDQVYKLACLCGFDIQFVDKHSGEVKKIER